MIAGGGLAGILTAWRCLTAGNIQNVTIIEAGAQLAGDHTWSFNARDLNAEALEWVRPAVAHEWPAYHVHFPEFSRRLELPYLSTNSKSLLNAVTPFIENGQINVLTKTKVKGLQPRKVLLDNKQVIEANAVLNCMGHKNTPNRLLGYQKFVGQVVRTAEPHGLEVPIIMDATVTQSDGYRFVYCLPYSPDEVMIEDTYYEDGAELDQASVINRINAYAETKGWAIKEVLRTESGILPITLASDLNSQLKTETPSVGYTGLAGGLYHAVTGYSFPDAMRMATRISELKRITPANLYDAVVTYRQEHWEREKFFRLLNRMLFKAGKPEERYKVLQRFYRLNEDLVAAFYRGELTSAQKARILAGKPPVPVGAAIYNLSEQQFLKRYRSEH